MDRRELRAEVVLQRGDEEIARWAVTSSGPPDLDVVDQVARLALAARRMGCTVWLRHAGPDVLALLELSGLRDLVGRAGSEVVGEAEDGEEVGVEEVVMPDDPVA